MMTLIRTFVASAFLLLPLYASASDAVRVTGEIKVDPSQENSKTVTDSGNVVVWLEALPGQTLPAVHPQTTPLRLVQKNKRFEPGLLVVPVGARIEFPNEDPFFHNVFSLYQGKRFDLGLYEAGEKRKVSFDKPGVSYIFCNIHPEMKAVVISLTTPYYAVSDSSGKFSISGVPPGKYLLKVWYERALPDTLQSLGRIVEVSRDNETLDLIHIRQAPGAPDHHRNKFDQDYEHPP